MRNKLYHALAVFSLMLPLAGCYNQSDVQADYVSQQSDCRSIAEDDMDKVAGVDEMSSKQRNAVLVDHFSLCMNKNGWHVARPVKNPVVPTPAATPNTRAAVNASLPAQPVQASPPPVRPNYAAQPVMRSAPPNQAVRTQPSVLQPSGGTPALSAPATDPSSAPATYQPVPANGAAVGRQF